MKERKVNSKNFAKFKAFAESYCSKRGKKIIIINKKSIAENGARYGGWCDGKEMVIAGKHKLFEDIFIHEFSHMTQAVEDTQIWRENGDIWTGLAKKKVKILDWPEYIKTIELERDCEKRALKFIKKYQIMNCGIYAKKANMYLYYYQFVFLNKKWENSTSIYDCQEIYDKMPEKLLPMSAFQNINMEIAQIFAEFFKKKCKIKCETLH